MANLTIFITNSKSGAFYEISSGWLNAFIIGGHRAIHWDGNLDQWERHKPDIYIGCSGWRQKLPPNHKAKVAIHVNPYCDTIIQVPGGPVINEQRDAINWTLKQNPRFIFGYGTQDDVETLWCKWKDHGVEIVGMPNAADLTKYQPTAPDPKLACDVGWVGGYWGYKAINMDKYLLPVVRRFQSNWLGWSGPKGLWKGRATQRQVLALFNSAKICPCVVEPHTTHYGIDMPERIFKIIACGALPISDPVKGIERFFPPDILPTASSPQHYMELCEIYINMDANKRKEVASRLRKRLLENHTYLHRVKVFLEKLGYQEEAAQYDSLIAKACSGT
jgi:hypothetical protein